MPMKLHKLAYGLVLATTVAACSDEKKDSKEKEGVETVLPSLPNEVTVVPLEKRVFNHELISNGKVGTAEKWIGPVHTGDAGCIDRTGVCTR